ncbi:MAG: type II toxin-antitoxin system VapC family toxin [Thiolinea sp.]
MYLFDTDTLTNIVKPRPSPKLLARLQTLPQSEQYVSTVTIAEIVYGAMRSHRPDYHLHNLEHVLLPSVNVIGFDAKAAYACGHIRAELEQKGTPLALADLEIASIAIANDLVLVTHNVKHFERIGRLRYEDWV